MLESVNKNLILVGQTGTGKTNLIKDSKQKLDKVDTLLINAVYSQLDSENEVELSNRMKDAYNYENVTMLSIERMKDFDKNILKQYQSVIIEDLINHPMNEVDFFPN